MDCSLLDSFVLGISQARILEWVATFYSRDLLDADIEHESPVPPALLAGEFLTLVLPGKPNEYE